MKRRRVDLSYLHDKEEKGGKNAFDNEKQLLTPISLAIAISETVFHS